MSRIYRRKDQDIASFLASNRPSICTSGSWLQVYSSKYQEEEPNYNLLKVYQLVSKYKNLTQEEIEASIDELHKLAIATNCLVGKWMLKFKDDQVVDRCWEAIATAVEKDLFGQYITAKVSTKSTYDSMGEDLYTICIYTRNFMDKEEVMAVRKKLKEMEIDKECAQTLYYKPDLFTYLGTIGNRLNGATYVYIDDEK
jgi:hypothetical protein